MIDVKITFTCSKCGQTYFRRFNTWINNSIDISLPKGWSGDYPHIYCPDCKEENKDGER